MVANGKTYLFAPLQLYYFPPQTDIEVKTADEPGEYAVISFKSVTIGQSNGQSNVEAELAQHPVFVPGQLPAQAPGAIEQWITNTCGNSGIMEEASAQDFSRRLQLEQLILSIMLNSEANEHRTKGGIERSIDYMSRNLSEKLDLRTLAGIAEMSCDTYARQFKRKIAHSPLEYLNGLRMEKAKKLLASGDSRVKEVAAEVGFNSEFYFSRMFSRAAGVSPSIYIKRRNLKVALASSLGFQDIYASFGGNATAIVDLYKYPWMTDTEYGLLIDNELARLKAARPDLIIADHYCCELYEELRRIAPTVILDEPNWNWRGNCLRMADLTGLEAEAGKVLDRLDRRTYETSSIMEKRLQGERITVMRVTHETIGIQGTVSHPLNELLYQELGLKAGKATPTDIWRQELSPEDLPPIETHHLFVQKHHLRAGSESVFLRMTETASWQRIDAVRIDRYRFIPNWFTMSWTPVGRHRILNLLLEYTMPTASSNAP
ncbi:AraC family transcriptional regulator [Cohnella mopanensis]|uniref:AraC family transcriptional regulator n=1 Tax=Cohnella mopanensis TaxID=2911966 RepID=UPI001EF96929|nr:AraC family transcriptional regulator [Cohnella mopanensis]